MTKLTKLQQALAYAKAAEPDNDLKRDVQQALAEGGA